MRGTYIGFYFTPESERRLQLWCANEGITRIGRVDPRLHTTVHYSTQPVTSYRPMGPLKYPNPLLPTRLRRLGVNSEVLALSVSSSLLHHRFRYGSSLGLKSDWPEFTPHVSLIYDGTKGLDYETIAKLNANGAVARLRRSGPLWLGEEYVRNLE